MSALDRLMGNMNSRRLMNLVVEEAAKTETPTDEKKKDDKKPEWYDKTMSVLDKIDSMIPKESDEEKKARQDQET